MLVLVVGNEIISDIGRCALQLKGKLIIMPLACFTAYFIYGWILTTGKLTLL